MEKLAWIKNFGNIGREIRYVDGGISTIYEVISVTKDMSDIDMKDEFINPVGGCAQGYFYKINTDKIVWERYSTNKTNDYCIFSELLMFVICFSNQGVCSGISGRFSICEGGTSIQILHNIVTDITSPLSSAVLFNTHGDIIKDEEGGYHTVPNGSQTKKAL